MPVVNREALASALKQRRSVSVGSRTITELRDLPPDPPEGSSDPKVEGAILRHENGSLTRDGMEHAIKTGGGFLHAGQVITRMEDAPTPEEMAAGDAAQFAALQADLDRREAELAERRTRLKEMHAAAQEAKASAQRDAKEQAGAEAVAYDDWTAEDLHAEASKREIEGRSSMDRAALAKALKRSDRDAAKAKK